ncbi:glycogen debranching enzyme isoform X2 [Rhodnius prolixus]|uniref:glycogen debranching enzyme isoform X2 n=1 Tax=Rhodnius prolixus TaxID=13249 RepID=UPI003D18D70E
MGPLEYIRALFSWLYLLILGLFYTENGFLASKSKIGIKPDVKRRKMDGPIIDLELNKGENREKELFRIRKDYQVRLKEGPSLYGCNVRVYTNLPEFSEQKFERSQYRLVKDGVLLADRAGSFHYYFVIGTSDSRNDAAGEGYILVEPNLTLNGEELPLDCIQCVTVLSKCLGPMSTWNDRLSIAVQSGYNMVHFTPIQQRGKSNSAYSINDQLSIDQSFAEGPFQTRPTMEQVGNFMENLRKEHKVLSICDVVLNHTATEAEWLQSHPECAYNLMNTPHLRPAYFLDRLLKDFSKDIANGMYDTCGLTAEIETEEHLQALRHQLNSVILPAAKIAEFYTVDIKKLVAEFSDRCYKSEPARNPAVRDECRLKVIQDPLYERLKSTVDLELAVNSYNIYRSDCFDEDTRKRKCTESFKKRLEQLNDVIQKEIDDHLQAAVENIVANVRYFRVQNDGPKLGVVTAKSPLVARYFVDWKATSEDAMFNNYEGAFIMAHNGWVMDHDPLQDFAQPGSNVYLRRELIPWTDSVKLRYGDKREDCPYLWDRMDRYVSETARIFDGIRLDNCHSTPIHVAQYLLDSARAIKPDLYVVAELFTNSDLTDNVFVNKLGITSLIRECMSAWDSHEVGRLVYRFGGWSIGSLSPPRIAAAKIAHALFMDQTHDNPSPVKIDVVKEDRVYMHKKDCNENVGISHGKRALNKLHYNLAREGFNQVFVDQVDREIVCVTRQNPRTLDSVLLFAHNSFGWPDCSTENGGIGKGITVDGIAHSVILEAWLKRIDNNNPWHARINQFKKNPNYINGLDEYKLELKEGITVEECTMARIAPCGHTSTRIDLTKAFKPGSVLAIRIINRTNAREAAAKLYRDIHKEFLDQALQNLNLIHMNHILYKCSEEEEGGSYDVPNFGKLVYCGLQGIMSVLEKVFKNEDIGHPICDNIRNGPWLGEYTVNRLKRVRATSKLGQLIEENLKLVEQLPRGYRPWGIYRVLSQVYQAVIRSLMLLMSDFIKNGDEFTKELALISIQMCGAVASAPLPPLSERISPPKLDARKPSVTLAAGLPHFATGYMRSWGRDTFISLRGLLLITGRFDEARYLILGYGACLRHGLIPNLLNGADLNPRYNCRDAVWWWLHSIKEYCKMVPDGYNILNEPVNRLFPNDDAEKPEFQEQILHDVMQEALNAHFQGLCFRERNAGLAIDQHMTSNGFDNQIGVHPKTGFVFGGNQWNCGTWMDKMGSSNEAGTLGRPATPRDGAAVEIVGLSMAIVSWLDSVSPHQYPHIGVTRVTKSGETISWTWEDWVNRIKSNFETEFYIPLEERRDTKNENDKYVHKRGIYKDTCGASQPWSDYRLRPNFLVAMVVAPNLFSPSNARTSLDTASILLGLLGLKTLDPDDLAYCGNYDNSNQSSDFRVAHGYNYHQGPEWLWPTGYYLRSLLKTCEHSSDSVEKTRKWLGRLWSTLRSSDWHGLPELTNENGAHCPDACPTQAWSAASILEVLYELHGHYVNKTA